LVTAPAVSGRRPSLRNNKGVEEESRRVIVPRSIQRRIPEYSESFEQPYTDDHRTFHFIVYNNCGSYEYLAQRFQFGLHN